MKKILTVVLTLTITHLFAQDKVDLFTVDIDNFWEAYDSIQYVDDYSEKIKLINDLYLNKETEGLKKFRELRNYSDSSYVRMIEKYPSFFESIRPNVNKLVTQKDVINAAFLNFGERYPDFKGVDIYFTIGCFNSGGTIADNMILLGAEILAVDSTTTFVDTDLKWLQNYAQAQTIENIGFFVLHEYVHVLQKKNNNPKLTVLSVCIGEGSADFIAELVTGRPLNTPYRRYGEQHFKKVKEDFKKEMLSTDRHSNWLYNGSKVGEAGDLGYFMGYAISKAYYEHASDKRQAIKDIIELDYADEKAVENFLHKSKFY